MIGKATVQQTKMCIRDRLTTESLAVFIPFKVQDIYHENGIYYGQNVISKNMIIADRRPVSYTHLDVYKRQRQRCAETCN